MIFISKWLEKKSTDEAAFVLYFKKNNKSI